jgi:cell division protease FtsH
MVGMSKQASPPPAGDKPGPGAPPPPPEPPKWRHWVWLIAIVAAVVLWYLLPAVHQAGQTTLNYTQFHQDALAHKVSSITISPSAGGTSTGTLTDGTHFSVIIPEQVGNVADQLVAEGVKVTSGSSSAGFGAELLNWLIILLPFVLFFWFWRRLSSGAMGQMQGVLGVGRSRAKVFDEEKPSTTFADVAGYEGAKSEISEVVDFLRNPDRYARAGAVVPRGVLMVGRGRRGARAVLLGQRLKLRRDVRRRGRRPGP